MTPPYLFISFTALLLEPGTRKRPPQSGSVLNGHKMLGRRELKRKSRFTQIWLDITTCFW